MRGAEAAAWTPSSGSAKPPKSSITVEASGRSSTSSSDPPRWAAERSRLTSRASSPSIRPLPSVSTLSSTTSAGHSS